MKRWVATNSVFAASARRPAPVRRSGPVFGANWLSAGKFSCTKLGWTAVAVGYGPQGVCELFEDLISLARGMARSRQAGSSGGASGWRLLAVAVVMVNSHRVRGSQVTF
jgi:hypothetical protein